MVSRLGLTEIIYCKEAYTKKTDKDRKKYNPPKNLWGGLFLAGNHNNHKNWVPSILPHNLCLISMRMKQKKFFLINKYSEWPTQKNWDFQNHQFSIFFAKISGIGPYGLSQGGLFLDCAMTMPFASINYTNPKTNPWNF